jgi:ubiquinone biosynthesis accessory factor UbiJ
VLRPILHLVEHVLNGALLTDPETLGRLSALQGRVVAVDLLDLQTSVFALPHAHGIRLQTQHEGPVHVRLRGTPMALLALVTNRGRQQATFSRDVEISGDLSLSQHLQALIRGLNLDWEELLSQKVGDVAARHLGNVLRQIGSWGKRTRQALESDVSEFLRQEVRLLPQRAEVERFLDSVDTLRADTDRLQQRLQRLQGPARGGR